MGIMGMMMPDENDSSRPSTANVLSWADTTRLLDGVRSGEASALLGSFEVFIVFL